MKFIILEYKKVEINIPEDVYSIDNIFKNNGFELYAVGGAIRDSLMGKTPKDWDLTTNAKPEEIIDILENSGLKVIPTGLKHGTVTVMLNDEPYEITTFRSDKNTGEGHKNVDVEFVCMYESNSSNMEDNDIYDYNWDRRVLGVKLYYSF